jgi:hypothetical protein
VNQTRKKAEMITRVFVGYWISGGTFAFLQSYLTTFVNVPTFRTNNICKYLLSSLKGQTKTMRIKAVFEFR